MKIVLRVADYVLGEDECVLFGIVGRMAFFLFGI